MLTTFQIRTWLRQLSGIKHSKRISEVNEVKRSEGTHENARLGQIVVGWQVDMTWKPSIKWINFKIIPNLWKSALQTVKSPLIQDTASGISQWSIFVHGNIPKTTSWGSKRLCRRLKCRCLLADSWWEWRSFKIQVTCTCYIIIPDTGPWSKGIKQDGFRNIYQVDMHFSGFGGQLRAHVFYPSVFKQS